MNQIRQTKTQSTKESRANWELNALRDDEFSVRDEQTKAEIMESWNQIRNSGDKAKNAELDMMARISSVAQEDTLEKRVAQVIKEVKANSIIEQKLQDLQTSGQSVDEFQEQQDAFGRKYRNIVIKARQEAGL